MSSMAFLILFGVCHFSLAARFLMVLDLIFHFAARSVDK